MQMRTIREQEAGMSWVPCEKVKEGKRELARCSAEATVGARSRSASLESQQEQRQGAGGSMTAERVKSVPEDSEVSRQKLRISPASLAAAAASASAALLAFSPLLLGITPVSASRFGSARVD